jgi:hypothetical protein
MFDRIIIGSSPISLLHAISFSNKGFETAVIDDGDSLGGAWSIHEWGSMGYTEKACHLIEYYEGIYELLESISGHKFKKLEPQPIKIWDNSVSLSYSSKKLFIFQFLKLIPKSIIRFIAKSIVLVVKLKLPTERDTKNLFRDFKLLGFLFRYRILSLLKKQYVEGPEGGWLAFTETLIGALEGVEVINARVKQAIEQKDNTWKVVLDNNEYYVAKKLVMTESVESVVLDKNNNKHISTSNRLKVTTDFYHILISIDDYSLVNPIPYIHFPENENIKRITPLHPCGFGLKERGLDGEFVVKKIRQKSEILVQLRKPPEDIDRLTDIIASLLLGAGVTDSLCEITTHDYFTESRLMIGNEKVLPGTYNNLIVLKSVGDLGISVLQQKDTLC